MRLSDIRISLKTSIAFGAMVAMMLIVGGFGLNGLLSAKGDFGVFKATVEAGDAEQDAQVELFETRLAAARYVLTNSEDEFRLGHDRLVEMRKHLDQAASLAPDRVQREHIQQMRPLVDAYGTAFDSVAVQRRKEDDILNKRMNVIGVQASQALERLFEGLIKDGRTGDALIASSALNHLTNYRLNAIKAVAGIDEQNSTQRSAEFREAAVKEVAVLESRPDARTRELTAEARKQLDAYAQAVDEGFAAHAERVRIFKESLTRAGVGLTKAFQESAEANGARQDEIGRQIATSVGTASLVMAVVAIIAIIFGFAAAFTINRGVARPIIDMTRVMGRLAQGELTVNIPHASNGDEIGDMAKAVSVFKDNAIRVEAMRREQEQAEARAAAERKKALNGMADAFETSVMGVVNVVSSSASQMTATAQSLSASSEETTVQATTVAAAAEQATSNVQTVATAAEELSASINEISRQVAEAARISTNAAEESGQTTDMIHQLANSANRISQVVSLITDIASQTNLLALNATIEAARAGEAGKGFAVVANEVKGLANQTAKATEEIGGQIAAVQEDTRRAVQAIERIAGTISQVREISSSIASAVEEQGAATQEIARNVQQAAQGTQEVSHTISSVTEAAASSSASATEVLTSAQDLAANSNRLAREVENFLATVRAG